MTSRGLFIVILSLLFAGSEEMSSASLSPSASAAPSAAPSPWAAVTTGAQFTCATHASTRYVYCFGRNDFGQLGTLASDFLSAPSVPVGGLAAPIAFLQVSCAQWHCIGVLINGSLASWGRCDYGACGRTTATTAYLAPAVLSNGPQSYVFVSAGRFAGCGIEAGTRLVYCWGRGEMNGLAYSLSAPTSTRVNNPVLLKNWNWTSGLQAVSVNLQGIMYMEGHMANDYLNYGAVATVTDVLGVIYSWGYAAESRAQGMCRSAAPTVNRLFGVLSDGGPVQVCITPSFRSVAAQGGGYRNDAWCAVTLNGTGGVCWGVNSYGRMGTATPTQASSYMDMAPNFTMPAVITQSPSGAAKWTKVAVGATTSCSIDSSGAMYCYGSSSAAPTLSRLFLDGPSPPNLTTPTAAFPALHGAVAGGWADVSMSSDHDCALTKSGALWCQGAPSFGMLGGGVATQSLLPSLVANSTLEGVRFVAISAGAAHVLALNGSGSLFGWGSTAGDALPYVSAELGKVGVQLLLPGTRWLVIRTQAAFSCGIRADNNATYCWGSNSLGECGVGVVTATWPAPTVAVGGGIVFSQIDVGSSHACGLVAANGSIMCWGSNSAWQLGISPQTGTPCVDWVPDLGAHPVATTALGGAAFVAVSAGSRSTCAIRPNGSLTCWGCVFVRAHVWVGARI